MAKLSVELNRYFFAEDRAEKVTLNDILALTGERGFGFLFVILALPSALPIPAPGYSTPFGLLLFFLAVQFIGGAKRPWLPQRMANWGVSIEVARQFAKGGIPWLERLERVTQPRLTFLCQKLPGRAFVGIAIALMSISMMLIIPGTNTLPAIGIFLIGIGLFEDDGVICLAGTFFCGLIAALMGTIIWLFFTKGPEAIEEFKELLKSRLGLG